MTSIEQARHLFAERGYKLLETEYVSGMTPMRYVCTCGQIRDVPLKRLKRGESGCKPCSVQRGAAKRRFSLDQVRELFAANGCKLLETEYKASTIPMLCRCLSCGSVRRRRLSDVIRHRCKVCVDEAKAAKR